MTSRPTALEALAEDPPAAGLILDFDGTLSPIINDPAASALPAPTVAALARLAPRLGLLAVISGRPAAFLSSRVTIPGIRLLGSYGMEEVRDGTTRLDPGVTRWLGPVRAAAAALDDLLGGQPGIGVEHKPASVTAHWRQAPDHAAAAARVRQAVAQVAADTGLRAETGKLFEELRPPVATDKGTAVRALLAATPLAAVAYAGDDLGDLPALGAVRAADGYALVVDHGAETDPRLLDAADQVFAGPPDLAAWLTALAAATAG